MQFLNLTLPRTSENLALDEALLDRAESNLAGGQPTGQFARLWQPTQHAVIVGRGSRVEEEVDRDFCQRHSIPIFRRHSGGATVVIGPGSLMYAVVISFLEHPELRDLNQSHHHVMTRMRQAVLPFCPSVQIQGICDLTYQDRKFSGNSLKVGRQHFLYHGTILFDMDLPLLASCLRTPPRQLDYRQRRPHGDFVTNLPVPSVQQFPAQLEASFRVTWQATETLDDWPEAETRRLAAEKYEQDEWNFRR